MKFVVLFVCICAASAQFNRQRPNRFQNQQRQSGVAVDNRFNNKEYHFSWRHTNGREWEWGGADSYCKSLGNGWQQINIKDGQVFNMVDNALRAENVKYIWTSGRGNGFQFQYGDGQPISFGWSHTGGSQRPQPDNREGNEFCVATLNDFYKDGTKLHDVACHHRKPTICERATG